MNDASDFIFSLPFDLGVDDMRLLRVLRDVRRKEIFFVSLDAVLSICEREGPLLVWCQVGGGER